MAKKKSPVNRRARTAPDSFKIQEGVPEAAKHKRLGYEMHTKLVNTLKLLTPNKRSTVLDKNSRDRIFNLVKKEYPEMKLRSTRKDESSYIVWREK